MSDSCLSTGTSRFGVKRGGLHPELNYRPYRNLLVPQRFDLTVRKVTSTKRCHDYDPMALSCLDNFSDTRSPNEDANRIDPTATFMNKVLLLYYP
jgi:hypothetical protein